MQRETGLTEELELLMSRRHGERRDGKEEGIVLGADDLQAIADLMDNRISNALKESEVRMAGLMDSKISSALKESEVRMAGLMDSKISSALKESEVRMAGLMDSKISNALKESETRMTEAIKESRAQIIAFIEGHVDPKIAAIGEGHQLTQEMLRETNKKLDDLTEKVDFHVLSFAS